MATSRALAGVGLNYLVPPQLFEIVLNIASLDIISTWAFIVACQMKSRERTSACRGRASASWLILAFLFGVLVLMALDYPTGTFTVAALPVKMVLLALGWLVLRSALTF